MSFGMLGASTLASWGTLGRSWDDPGTLEGTRKDLVRSRLGFYRFLVDLGAPFREIFGSKFGCLGLEKHAFGMEGIAKINFRRNWISYDSRIDFS